MAAVLFVTDELLLKASHYQSKWINGYNRGGAWIHAHQKNVLVSDNHDDEKVASGQGSFYQKQAHKQAHAEVEGFADLPVEHKAAIVLSHATTLQKEASASAAVSGFKASMMAGKMPTPAQYKAMHDASSKVQTDVIEACVAKIGSDLYTKLLFQANAKAEQVSQPPGETLAQAKETAEAVAYAAQQQTPPGPAGSVKPAAGGAAAAEAEAAAPANVVVTSAPAPSGKTATIGGIGFVAVKKTNPKGSYWIPAVEATGQEIDHQSYPTKTAMWEDLEHVAKVNGEKFAWNMGVAPAGAAHDAGPKEGDTKVENGKTYKLFNGKWHRTDADGWTMTAKRLGMEAKKAGLPASPMSDPDFVAVHGTDQSSNKRIQAMSDYHKGWDKAEVESAVSQPAPVDDAIIHIAYGSGTPATIAAYGAMPPDMKSEMAQKASAKVAQDNSVTQEQFDANHKAAVAAMETGAFYQKEAIKKLKAEHGAAWDAMHSSKQHELAHAKYQALQGAASQAAAVSGWKKHMLAGQVPSPGEVKAFSSWALNNQDKTDKLISEVQSAIGADKMGVLVAQSHAKAAKAPASVPAPSNAKVFVTKPGNMTFEPVKPANAHATGAAAVLLSSKPAYDHLAKYVQMAGTEYAKKTQLILGAQDWLAANPDKEQEMHEALAALHIKQSIIDKIGMLTKPATGPAPVKIDVVSSVGKNVSPGHNKFWSVSVHGNVMKTTYGKIGTKGSTTTKEYPNPGAAAAAMAHLKQQKIAKGYTFKHSSLHEYEVAADPCSKDGDTKQGADGTLVFRDGHWHKQADQNAIEVPDFSDDLNSKWAKHYSDAAVILKTAFDASGPAGVKKLVTVHKTGAKAGRYSMTLAGAKLNCGPNDSAARRVKMHIFITAMLATKGGKKAVFTTATPAALKPAPTPAAKVFVQPMAKPTTVKTSDGKLSVTVIDSWAQTGKQKGSNPGGTFKDKAGQEWYCKFPASEDHCKNELLASKLYQAAGVDCPTLRLVKRDGKIGVASKIVPGVQLVGAGIKSVPGALEGFAVDAWLGNYDSVGTGHDNLLKTSDGKAIRIDVGGSLLYRAQGVPKGDAFGNDAVEIDGMRDPATNSYAASVFSGMSKSVLNESVALVLEMPNDVIQEIVGKYGPGSDAQKKALADKLIARKNSLAKKYPEADLIANPPKPDPSHLTIQKALLPKQLDFANWKGVGQGLSGTASINEVNQKAVNEIYAAAMKGDYVALKKLKYHIVDKATGNLTDGALFGDHPSQHVKDFYSKVIDYMEVVANPAAKKAKAWLVNDYSDIDELSDAFKAHFYGISVGAVPANQRLGFWISLGQADAAMSFMPTKVEYTSAADSTKGQKSTQSIPDNLRKWMKAVKGSGSANQPYRDGKEVDNQGQSTRDVLTEAYKHSVEFSEGTRITKNIDFPPAMLQQMLGLPEGHVFKNPGSMCCSLNKNWSGFSGNARLKIVYANGAKALYNIGVGSFSGEGEITTIPGQRFMLLEKTPNSHPPEFTLLMLPPDDTYVANIKPKG